LSQRADEGLLRVIGPFALAASIVNVVVGAGIFALPGALAAEVGAAAPLALLLSAACIGLVTVCMALAGRQVARSGGMYAYAEVAFGPFVGFLTGVVCWLSNVFASAGVASAVTDTLVTISPVFSSPWLKGAVLVALYGAFTIVNLRGVRAGSRTASAAAAIKFTALLVFLVVGVTLVRPENLVWSQAPSAAALGRSALLAVFGLSGMEVALGVSGEVRNPRRTIPLALAVGMTVIVFLYVAVQVVAQGALGPQLAQSAAPLAEALTRRGLSGGLLISIVALISMCGWITGDLLGSPRILFAFARDGLLPSPFAKVHPRFHVPHVSIIAHAIVACSLALTGTFRVFAILASISSVVLYIACCAAAWRLSHTEARAAGRSTGFVGTAVPVLAVVGQFWMLSYSSSGEILAIAGVIAVAAAVYLARTGLRRVPT
jgi:amino acid transporter